jgi:hypothetical protein
MSYGRVTVGVTWVNPYSGIGGTAGVLPQNDEFAYFYYSDPKNPEVFVKVLGDNNPDYIQLFVGGTTDFEYTVTFSGCGTVVTFHKPPYVYTGTVSASVIPNPSCARGAVWAAQAPVTSLNGMRGDLTLAAGTGIAVTPTAGTLTISTTGSGSSITGVSAGTGLTGGGTSGNVTLGIAGGGVTSAELAASAVTTPKLAASAVTSGAIASGQVVKTLNGLTDAVALAAGSNIALTPSGNTLTIAAIPPPGGLLPSGSMGQTLRSDGTSWKANSLLYNSGSAIGINTTMPVATLDVNGTLHLPWTTAPDGGVLYFGVTPFLHNFTPSPTNGGNTFLGVQAGNFTMGGSGSSGRENTGIGYYNLNNVTIGSQNTATGYASLAGNTAGSANTAIGAESLTANTSGYGNTAAGVGSLSLNTTGSGNVAVGLSALYAQSFSNAGIMWSSFNTAVGAGALMANQPTSTGNGSMNTAVGSRALLNNTAGFENTAIGSDAGNSSDTITTYAGGTITLAPNKTGSYNTFLGYRAGAAASVSNCTAVGVDAYCMGDNQVRLGNASVTSIGGKVAWSALSDLRTKTDLRGVPLGLDFVMALRPVAYRLRDGNGRLDMGFVAQDVESLLGNGYNVLDVGSDPDRTLSLRHSHLIAPLVKAVQEQQAQIEAQSAEITALKARLRESEDVRAILRELEARLARAEGRLADH